MLFRSVYHCHAPTIVKELGVGCDVSVPMEMQGEAIAFAAAGLDYYTTSEGAKPPLYRFTRG